MVPRSEEIRSRAWLLVAEFTIAGHPLIADIRSDKLFPEYVRKCFEAQSSYFTKHMKGLMLLSFSMPTALSSLRNREVVPVVGILYDLHLVYESTVQGILRGVDGLNTTWGALHFGPRTDCQSLDEHPAFLRFLRESSLGGIDPALMCRIDCKGVSDARQETIRALEERDRTWRFEAVIDVAHHPDLVINSSGVIASDYFEMHILRHIENWGEKIEKWDLFSYSVPLAIGRLDATWDSIHIEGYLHLGSQVERRSALQGMLDGFPGITVNWTAMHLGRGHTLASNTEYRAFLTASTKEKDGADLNPSLKIRVDVRGSTEAPLRKRGPAPWSQKPRPPLAVLDSLLNAIGNTALPGFHTLADSAAKTTASRARALPALPAPPAAAPTPRAALAAQVGIAPPRPARLRLSRPPARARPRPRRLHASARLSRLPARPPARARPRPR